MMCAISEAWTIMTAHLEMRYDDVGKIFEKWTSEGELVCPPSCRIVPVLT
jgi:6-phosphogluconate dehydrogenase